MAITLCSCSKEQASTTTKQSVKTVATQVEQKVEELKTEGTPKIKTQEIRELKVTSKNQEQYHLKYIEDCSKDAYLRWRLLNPYEGVATINSETMYQLFDTVTSASIKEIKKNNKISLKNATDKIQINYLKDAKDTTGKADYSTTLVIGEAATENTYYCAYANDIDHLYQIDKNVVDVLLHMDPMNLILKIPYLVNIKDINKVEMQFGDKKGSMSQENEQYKINNKKVKQRTYQSLFSNLMQLTITSAVEKENVENAERVASISYKGFDKANDCNVDIYLNQKNQTFVVINGKPLFYVDDNEAKQLCKVIASES